MLRDPDDILAEEGRRQKIVERAVQAADRIICEGCDGDNDLLFMFTTELSVKFSEKSSIMARAALSRREMIEDIQGLDSLSTRSSDPA